MTDSLTAPGRRRLLLAAGATWLAGCGGGEETTQPQLRLVNAAPDYPRLDLRVGGTVRQAGVAYGQTADYVAVDRDDTRTELTLPGSSTPLLTLTPVLTRRRHSTLLAHGSTGALRQLLLDDEVGEPADGRAVLRVINAAPDAGALDVYLTGATDSLATAVPLLEDAGYGSLSALLTVEATTWRLRVTGANATSDLRLDLPDVALGNRQVVTLVLAPSAGGVLVQALWMVQRGAVSARAGTQARVRLAAMAGDGATAGAAVGSVALGSSASAGTLGSYRLVAAAPAVVPTVVVAGQALAVPATALEAGRDYTLLVHGQAGTYAASWIADTNRLAVAGQARVRVVHAVAGLDVPLALSVDLVAVGGAVARGQASDYESVTATEGTGTVSLAVGVPGQAGSLVSLPAVQLLSTGVYTVFVTGTAGAATAVVRRDR